MRTLLLLVMLAGCAAAEDPPVIEVAAPIVLRPPPRISKPASDSTTQATARVLDDTRATQARATCFVLRSNTPAQAIDETTRLTRASALATARVRAHRGKAGAPPADIRAARAAADALAAHLPNEPPPGCPDGIMKDVAP